MLLISAIRSGSTELSRFLARRATLEALFRDKSFGTRLPSITIDIHYLPSPYAILSPNLPRRFVERLRQVSDDVVNMFYAHAQPDHFRRHACFQLFFRS